MVDLLVEGMTFALLLEKVSSAKGAWKVQLTQTFDDLPTLPEWAEPHREGIIAALHGERGLKATIDFADRELRQVRLHVTGEQASIKPDEYEHAASGLHSELVWNVGTVASVQLLASVKTGELVVRWTLLLPTVPGAWGRLACEAQLLARCLGRQPDLEIRNALEDQEGAPLFERTVKPVAQSGITPPAKVARARVTRSRVDA